MFYSKRKELIKEALKNAKLNQQEFGKILGHSKTYISELMNGVRSFSKDDLVVIHHLFDISYDALIPPFIKSERIIHIQQVLKNHPNSPLKFTKMNLIFV